MMKTTTGLLLILLVFIGVAALLVPPAAAETIGASNTVTMKGPYDLLVPLGIENFLPIDQARIYYNWISVFLIIVIGVMASSRTTRFLGILVPVVAALCVYFGWFTMNDPAAPEGYLLGVIIIGLVMAVAIYMKGSLHERFGIAGPGSLFFNVVFYIILLQATVGFVNSTHIWGGLNSAPTPTNEYTNIDIAGEIDTINNTGGGLGIVELGTVLAQLAVGCLQMFLSMGLALAAFSVVLGMIYPWMVQNYMGAGLLTLMQLGIYIVYYMAFMRMVWKPVGEGEF